MRLSPQEEERDVHLRIKPLPWGKDQSRPFIAIICSFQDKIYFINEETEAQRRKGSGHLVWSWDVNPHLLAAQTGALSTCQLIAHSGARQDADWNPSCTTFQLGHTEKPLYFSVSVSSSGKWGS